MLALARSVAVALWCVALISTASAKKKPLDLSDFAGNYTGSGTIAIAGTTTLPATETISVKVPKNGRSATVSVTGSITYMGSSSSFANVLAFASNKSFSVQDLLFHFTGSTTTGATGNFSTSKAALNFSAPFNYTGTTGSITGSLSTHLRGKKKRTLTLTYSLFTTGTPTPLYVFNFETSRKVKPAK